MFPVFTVAEAASLLYSGSVKRSELDNTQIKQWQSDILQTMYNI